MGLKFEEDTLESIVLAIKGADTLNFSLFILIYWGFVYAVINLVTSNLYNAILAGLMISILGICSLFNVVLEFCEYSIFKTHSGTRNKRRLLIIITLSLLIFLDLKGFVISGMVLEPLDFITNYLFFVLLIVPLSEGALDIITVDYKQNMQNFIGIKFDSRSEKILTYMLTTVFLTIVLAILYFALPGFEGLMRNNLILGIMCTVVPILLYLVLSRFRTSSVTSPNAREEMGLLLDHPDHIEQFQINGKMSKSGDINIVYLSELLLHIGAAGILMGFLYRAWLIHNKIENGETMEIFTIGLVVISGVVYSANKIKAMDFSGPGILSEYLFGMCALGIGGVVFAIIFNLKTGLGELNMDVAMTYFYVVQSLAIASALVMSVVGKVKRRWVKAR